MAALRAGNRRTTRISVALWGDLGPGSRDADRESELVSVGADFEGAFDRVVAAVDQVNAIYEELSTQNLNPTTLLYTVTAPFTMRAERAPVATHRRFVRGAGLHAEPFRPCRSAAWLTATFSARSSFIVNREEQPAQRAPARSEGSVRRNQRNGPSGSDLDRNPKGLRHRCSAGLQACLARLVETRSSAADEVHHLHLISLLQQRRVVRHALQHHQVVLDCHASGIDVQLLQQLAHCNRTFELEARRWRTIFKGFTGGSLGSLWSAASAYLRGKNDVKVTSLSHQSTRVDVSATRYG